jgi:sirohydrochlorin cobaltochelatase
MIVTRPSIIIVGHGSSTDSTAEDAVLEHAITLRQSHRFGNVLTHFVQKGRNLPALPEGEIFLLPFFMSNGFFVQKRIPDLFDLIDFERHDANRTIFQCDALGIDPELSEILETMGQQTCVRQSVAASKTAVILVAHGSQKNNASRQAAEKQAEALGKRSRFASVSTAFLEENPSLTDQLKVLAPSSELVILLGLFSAEGPHAMEDVPGEIEVYQKSIEASGGKAGRIHYGGVVGTRPEVVKLIQDSISRKAEQVGRGP